VVAERDKTAEAGPSGESDPLRPLTNVRFVALDRAPIRTRESSATRSAWRLQAASNEGDGTISLVEISPTVSLYRGEGVFLGWPAARLEPAYRALLPQSPGPDMEFNQLG
jgi:hypothetical protein